MSYLLACPFAARDARDKRGKIHCTATGELCVHVYFCQPKNKWQNTNSAAYCPVREEKSNGK